MATGSGANVMLQNSRHRWHLQAAQACLAKEKHGDALGHLVFLAGVDPSSKIVFEQEFNTALIKWTDTLYVHGETEKLVVCLKQAMKMYPDSESVMNNVGAVLCKLGLHDEAASCFRRALQVKPDSARAKENLENVASSLVERWHFRMLNDAQRNKAYKEAITRAVADGYDVVLDIGSGTGILSMFAVQAGATEVYACEMSRTMYEMSLDILRANHMEEAVKLIHKKSTEIEVGKEIPKHVSLVVTETLDCGLLGEGILTTIKHAWSNLLTAPPKQNKRKSSGFGEEPDDRIGQSSSRVIPAGAVVHAMAISSEAIRNQSRNRRNVCGIDLSSLYLIGGEELQSKSSSTASENLLHCIEPYTTECLNTLQNGYVPLTDVFQVAKYNFSEPGNLESEGDLYFEVPVSHSGHLDAIAMWFELKLDDVTSISTGPEANSLCWEQAVFPVYSHHFNEGNLKAAIQNDLVSVEKGSTLLIHGKFTEEFLTLQCTDLKESARESSPANHRASDLGNPPGIIQPEDSELNCHPCEHSVSSGQIAVVSPCHMRCLNDVPANSAYDRAITKAVKSIISSQLNNMHTDSQNNQVRCRVIDITYGASLCGLLAAQAGADHVLICNPDISFASLENLRKANNLPDVIEYGPKKLEQAVMEGRAWDILVADVVEPSGVIRPQVVEDIVFARGCLLKPRSGLVLPQCITVHGMCINSPFLVANSHVVSHNNTLGLDIGRFINHFQVSTHLNVDITTLNYAPITDQFELFQLDFMQCVDDDQELLSLLEIESEQRVTVTTAGRIQAIPYWFTIHLDESNALTTNSGLHWRQAVVILESELDVQQGDILLVSASYKNSCLSVKVQKAEQD